MIRHYLRQERVWFAILFTVFAAAVAGLWFVVLLQFMRPPPVTFDALRVVGTPVREGGSLWVDADTTRREVAKGCTNGFQADARSREGEEIRLTPRTRTIDTGHTLYEIPISGTLGPGKYEVRLRETFKCTDPVETPWLPFEVTP